jgi:hypothetical protein
LVKAFNDVGKGPVNSLLSSARFVRLRRLPKLGEMVPFRWYPDKFTDRMEGLAELLDMLQLIQA